jgi:hypothetical protein
MSQIIDPNIDPVHNKMDQQARNLVFMRLKSLLPKYTKNLQSDVQRLENRFAKMYADGPNDTLDNYHFFNGDYRDVMASAEELIAEIKRFETLYLTWMSQVHGEKKVSAIMSTLTRKD